MGTLGATERRHFASAGEDPRKRVRRRPRRSRTTLANPLVLLVEDNDDARQGYLEYFRFKGRMMVAAVDGREALDLAARMRPDVIVMDLAMPRMGGWTAIRKLKSRIRTAQIPILALSAYASDEDQERAFRAGADAFRAKPCLPHELVDEIQGLLRRHGGGGSPPGRKRRTPPRTGPRRRRSTDPR
jgi:CheY-like chemotaxis protein